MPIDGLCGNEKHPIAGISAGHPGDGRAKNVGQGMQTAPAMTRGRETGRRRGSCAHRRQGHLRTRAHRPHVRLPAHVLPPCRSVSGKAARNVISGDNISVAINVTINVTINANINASSEVSAPRSNGSTCGRRMRHHDRMAGSPEGAARESSVFYSGQALA